MGVRRPTLARDEEERYYAISISYGIVLWGMMCA